MNKEQIKFKQVIKARRKRVHRLRRAKNGKYQWVQVKPAINKMGWFKRFVTWLKEKLKS